MLARCSVIRVVQYASRRPQYFPCRCTQPARRRYASTSHGASATWSTSGSSGAMPVAPGIANFAPLSSLVDELDAIAPSFEVEDGNIEIIEGPVNFYKTLKAKILQAKRQIYLSTLYIGKTEHELISTVRAALLKTPSLRVSFLSDALRGTRETPEPTTASLLAPLISEFGPERVQIRMFHTPNLTGLKKRLIPKRINEGWGLQHMKLYGIDDEIILSGANLSEDYFTNRLDRYHVFRSRELTEYYERIHHAVSSISFDVQPDTKSTSGYTMEWPETNPGPNPLKDSGAYISHASTLLAPLIGPQSRTAQPLATSSSVSQSRTLVYPVFQLTPLFSSVSLERNTKPALHSTPQRSTELPVLIALLTHLTRPPFAPAQLTFTAGYFNPYPLLIDLLLSAAAVTTPQTPSLAARLNVIAASPYANGFYGSKGISGMLPPAYTLLCRRFLEEAQRRGLLDGSKENDKGVRLREWRRGTVGEDGGWTYHAKGIWVTLPPPQPPVNDTQTKSQGNALASKDFQQRDAGPSITMIGSSNYTQRSYTLDLEANALIITRDPGLQKRLREEEEWLGRDAKEMELREYERTERRVGLGVRIAMWITKTVGGAL